MDERRTAGHPSRMRQVHLALGVGASVALHVHPACAADEVRARLHYERSSAATACADESGMRDAVAARLGHDPFVVQAAQRLSIALDRRGGEWQARIELEDATGAKKGSRSLSSREKSCDELVSAVSLAVALAIDPMHFSQAPAEPPRSEAVPPSPPPPSEPPQPPPPVPERVRPGAAMFASVGAFVAGGVVPSVSFGPRLRGGLAWPRLSVAMEGTYVAKGVESSSSGRVEASVIAGGLLPCVRLRPSGVVIDACGRGVFGALFGEARGVGISTPSTEPHVALGVEIAAELPLTKVFGIRAFAGTLGTVTRTFLRIRDKGREVDVWRSPPFSAGGGVDAVVYFP